MIGTVESAVAQLGAAVSALLEADFDSVASTGLVEVLREVERHKRRLGAVDVRLLVQVRDRHVARELCRSSSADLLVHELRVAPAEATARVLAAEDCGPRLTLSGEVLEPVLPRVADAQRAGDVSGGHVSVIGKTLARIPDDLAVEATPVAEALLVQAARHEDPRALERTGQLLLARLDPDGAEPRERRRREFTLARHGDGWTSPRGNLDPATTAALSAAVDALSAPHPAQDGTTDPRTPGERRHDALHEIAQRLLRAGTLPDAGGLATTVVVTGTVQDWFGHPQPSAGTTDGAKGSDPPAPRPTGSGLVRGARDEWWRLGDSRPCADPFCNTEIVALLTTASGAPLALGRTRRLASASQRIALAARDRGCCFPGCDRPPAWTEAHHIRAWQDGGATDLDNLCLLCAFHHREFDRRGWAVHIAADGRPDWTPPRWIDPERKPVRNRAHHHDEIEFSAPG